MLSNLKRNEMCKCCLSGDERIQMERSKRIDRELGGMKRRFLATQKIVLLGAGESGKSTFLKQMQIIHGAGFNEKEIIEYRTQIYENILKGMVGLINGKTHLGLAWGDEQSDTTVKMKKVVSAYRVVFKCLMDDRELDAKRLGQKIPIFPEQFLANNSINLINELWNDRAIRQAYDRRREFSKYFVENVPYYIENLNRIADRNNVCKILINFCLIETKISLSESSF
ncbi:guanine nucleotide-binding subunit alpha -like protein [Brachionus plicatilis]|uniref:Guanine nucleotide-binding subunit alpha-like protein n=1 Tax=Brachionus plicatilis TaxID=10195 RepID=A0A3M7Q6G2_BRAPC|nr:guanine nucleotide-binding subunit alpha -like protein [Brachionus plicatilis]